MKLTDITNPVSGSKGNAFSFDFWWSNILGVFFLLVIFNVGQKLASKVTGLSGGYVGSGFVTNPLGSDVVSSASAGSVSRLYGCS